MFYGDNLSSGQHSVTFTNLAPPDGGAQVLLVAQAQTTQVSTSLLPIVSSDKYGLLQ